MNKSDHRFTLRLHRIGKQSNCSVCSKPKSQKWLLMAGHISALCPNSYDNQRLGNNRVKSFSKGSWQWKELVSAAQLPLATGHSTQVWLKSEQSEKLQSSPGTAPTQAPSSQCWPTPKQLLERKGHQQPAQPWSSVKLSPGVKMEEGEAAKKARLYLHHLNHLFWKRKIISTTPKVQTWGKCGFLDNAVDWCTN